MESTFALLLASRAYCRIFNSDWLVFENANGLSEGGVDRIVKRFLNICLAQTLGQVSQLYAFAWQNRTDWYDTAMPSKAILFSSDILGPLDYSIRFDDWVWIGLVMHVASFCSYAVARIYTILPAPYILISMRNLLPCLPHSAVYYYSIAILPKQFSYHHFLSGTPSS